MYRYTPLAATSPAVFLPSQRAKELGYTAIKTSPHVTDSVDGRRVIKRPWNLDRAVKIIEEMRIEAGNDIDIMVDAHGLLTPVMVRPSRDCFSTRKWEVPRAAICGR